MLDLSHSMTSSRRKEFEEASLETVIDVMEESESPR
jgi:hypothetical protein